MYILSSGLHFSLSKLFVAGSHLALPSWWPLGDICHPNASPVVCVLEGIGAMISGVQDPIWWPNYATQQKRCNIKIIPYLKELSLTKAVCFGSVTRFARQQLGAILPAQLRQWSIDAVRQDSHGRSTFHFGPDGLLSGWLGKRILSGCYQMRRIRSHLAAAGPLPRWIHEVKGEWQYELRPMAQWYDPCPWSPPDHIWYPKREREAALVDW